MTTTTKPPAEVWLQWYGEDLDGLAPEPNHAPAEGSVTWSPERVYDSDVAYVLDSAGLRARAEKAEKALDEERRQRIHEAELAREAIGLLRDLVSTYVNEDDDTPSALMDGLLAFERKLAAARAWLDERVKV